MEMKSTAVAIALPFSCIIGLLALMISTTMVKRNYVWIFATIQFGLVVLFGHVFYSLVKQPVMCIVLATMIGFGLTMSGTTAITELLKWRSNSHHQPASKQALRWLHHRLRQQSSALLKLVLLVWLIGLVLGLAESICQC